ncbi:hypothetical protein [Actinoplanes sp. NPDC049316]|uniref:hypothetical protein n=1 Tax=Actinoplanes sp. NPDC049316 TaxID=3154727 RepID=UPI0034424F79
MSVGACTGHDIRRQNSELRAHLASVCGPNGEPIYEIPGGKSGGATAKEKIPRQDRTRHRRASRATAPNRIGTCPRTRPRAYLDVVALDATGWGDDEPFRNVDGAAVGDGR